jgi:hypothetical protein
MDATINGRTRWGKRMDGITVEQQAALASVAGSTSALLINETKEKWGRLFVLATVGAMVGICFAPSICHYYEIVDPRYIVSMGFLTGACGIAILRTVIRLCDDYLPLWLQGKLPGGPMGPRGPAGPTGSTGATGATGQAGSSN